MDDDRKGHRRIPRGDGAAAGGVSGRGPAGRPDAGRPGADRSGTGASPLGEMVGSIRIGYRDPDLLSR